MASISIWLSPNLSDRIQLPKAMFPLTVGSSAKAHFY
jgi:hypothetical protein